MFKERIQTEREHLTCLSCRCGDGHGRGRTRIGDQSTRHGKCCTPRRGSRISRCKARSPHAPITAAFHPNPSQPSLAPPYLLRIIDIALLLTVTDVHLTCLSCRCGDGHGRGRTRIGDQSTRHGKCCTPRRGSRIQRGYCAP